MEESPALRWDVRSARLTTFHSGKPSSTSWWQLLHGVRAIKRSKRGAAVEESGLFEGMNLLLSDQPTRFDLVMTPDPHKASPERPLPSIGTLDAVSQRIEQLGLKLTANKEYPTAHRLAFGITLFQVYFQRADALEVLAQVFPGLSRALRKSADFVFQINHPRMEEVEDISVEIHYLQKWYFSELKLEGGPKSGPIKAFTASVDCDISTAISPAQKWSANESAQIISHLIGGAPRALDVSTW
jgi:hypothetical protein